MQAVLSLWVHRFYSSWYHTSYSLSCKHVSCLTDTPQAEPQVWSWTLGMVWHTLSPYTRDSPFHIPSCAWTSPDVTSPDTSASSCARKATISTLLQSLRSCAPSRRYETSLQLLLDGDYNLDSKRWKKCCFVFQRACYLSLNPQKDETLETEKAQYTLPDGSTLDVRMRLLVYVSVW